MYRHLQAQCNTLNEGIQRFLVLVALAVPLEGQSHPPLVLHPPVAQAFTQRIPTLLLAINPSNQKKVSLTIKTDNAV